MIGIKMFHETKSQKNRILLPLSAVIFIFSSNSTFAQTPPSSEANSSLKQIVNCLDISDREARLACFDTHATSLKQEVESGNLVPVYRAEITSAGRSLFGIDRIRMPNFLGQPSEEISEINSTIVSANRSPNGIWRFVLDDGSEWNQIDTSNPYFSSRPGSPVRIRRGSMDSYLLTVDGSSAMRVSRRR